MRRIDTSKLYDASDLLDFKYGKEGTESREEFNKASIAFYYGTILKEKRIELNLTQESLAEKAGLKRSYIAKVEKGKTDIQISSLIRITQALGINVSLL